MYRILVVDDETHIREGIGEYLTEVGYEVVLCENGGEARQKFQEKEIDLVILDLIMPEKSGFVVLETIRKESDVPIIIFSGLEDEESQLKGYTLQADDYITKPFSLVILRKKIEAILARTKGKYIQWQYQDVSVDFSQLIAKYKGEMVDLKGKDFEILAFFLKNKGRILSREVMLDGIWPMGEYPSDRIIDVYVKNLRKKLHLNCIETIKGMGYRFNGQ